MPIPPPDVDWYSQYKGLANVNTQPGPPGKVTVQLSTTDVPDWAREVQLCVNMFVKGKGTSGDYTTVGGNLYFWTEATRRDNTVGMAAYQAHFGSVAGVVSSTTLSGWCPINQDNRNVYLQVDLNTPVAVDIMGGTLYLMGYR